MSDFAEYLRDYMKERQITPAELARETGIERTVVYRYIKGRRIPSEESVVLKIADALRMTAREKQNLMEKYDRLNMGDLTVDGYQYVRQLLEDIHRAGPGDGRASVDWSAARQNRKMDQRLVLMHSKEEIVTCVLGLFEYIAGQEQETTLHLLMQPVYESIQNFLLPFFEGKKVKIEQIVCLEQNLSKSYENLKVFRHLLPLCFGDLRYEAAYYYANLSQHINDMSWMPNILIVENYVLQFNYDMSRGTLTKDASYAAEMEREYHARWEQTTSFLIGQGRSVDATLFDQLYGSGAVWCDTSLFAEPCIGLCMSSDIYRKFLHPFPQKDALIENIVKLRGDWKENVYYPPTEQQLNSEFTVYSQKRGLLGFMETGVTHEFPAALYHPLDRQARGEILKRMIYLGEKGMMLYRFIPDEIMLPQNFYVYYQDHDKSLHINQMLEEGMAQVEVAESGIYRAFRCFLEYLEEKEMLLSSEETLQKMREVYDEMYDDKI